MIIIIFQFQYVVKVLTPILTKEMAAVKKIRGEVDKEYEDNKSREGKPTVSKRKKITSSNFIPDDNDTEPPVPSSSTVGRPSSLAAAPVVVVVAPADPAANKVAGRHSSSAAAAGPIQIVGRPSSSVAPALAPVVALPAADANEVARRHSSSAAAAAPIEIVGRPSSSSSSSSASAAADDDGTSNGPVGHPSTSSGNKEGTSEHGENDAGYEGLEDSQGAIITEADKAMVACETRIAILYEELKSGKNTLQEEQDKMNEISQQSTNLEIHRKVSQLQAENTKRRQLEEKEKQARDVLVLTQKSNTEYMEQELDDWEKDEQKRKAMIQDVVDEAREEGNPLPKSIIKLIDHFKSKFLFMIA